MKNPMILFIIGCTFLMISCTPVYVGNRQNVPLHTKKGEVKTTAAISISGIDLQASTTLSNKTAAMLNAQWMDMKDQVIMSDLKNSLKHKLVEAAFGYYNNIGTNGVFEMYAGYGMGTSFLNDALKDKTSKGDFQKWFIQPNVGFHSKYFSVGFGLRAQFIHYDKIVEKHTTFETQSNTVSYSNIQNAKGYYIDPSFTLKAGAEKFKVVGQIGASIPLTNMKYNHQPLLASLGVEYTFGK